ncbi:hypothetical protein PJI74_30735, partial [Mycobacterium kansasii]
MNSTNESIAVAKLVLRPSPEVLLSCTRLEDTLVRYLISELAEVERSARVVNSRRELLNCLKIWAVRTIFLPKKP